MVKYSPELKAFALDVYENNLWNLIYRKTYVKRDLYLECLLKTPFLNENCKIKESIYCIINEIYDDILCPTCSKPSKLNKRNKPSYCDIICYKSYIRTDGLTNGQYDKIKSDITLEQIDSKSNKTFKELSIEKMKNTKNSTVRLGLTNAKLAGLKQKITINTKINNISLIDIIQQKRKISMSQIDPETGLTGYQKAALKSKEKMSQIDPETGLTGYQRIKICRHNTLSKIDLETGLTGYQRAALKSKETNLKVDIETGLTGYQRTSRKSSRSMKQVDYRTGLTGYQQSNIKRVKTNRGIMFDFIINNTINTIISNKSDYIDNNKLEFICVKCNTKQLTLGYTTRCIKCHPYSRSFGENEVLEFCQSLTSNVISNDRKIIKPLELDIYLPDFNLAIEYNGLYWHSSHSIDSEKRDYHLNKTNLCSEKGVQLFHIFENEWLDPVKQKIWKSIISNKLCQSKRIYARKTNVRQVIPIEKSKFLNENHLQGNCQSSINLGLYLDDKLVALMTFGKSRYNKKIDFELLRFCNKVGCSVVGGAGKLLSAFRKENVGSIISYADKRRSTGNLYGALGFELSHDSGPNYWYWKDKGLESRIGYQKHKLKDKLDVYDSELSEGENMYMNGYRRVYDCGNQVWVLE